jgi:sterol desaturase/sphingolipid hydroxylase (fatty acid hydroxylase superfamily)
MRNLILAIPAAAAVVAAAMLPSPGHLIVGGVNISPWILPTVMALSLAEGVALSLRPKGYDWKAWFASSADAMLRHLVNLVPLSLARPAFGFAWQHRIATVQIGVWWSFVLLILGQEFCYYWLHRAGHRVRWFWASHAVHHSSNDYNLAAAYRLGWTSKLSGEAIFNLPLVWLGFPPDLVGATLLFNLLYQFWLHTELVPRLSVLEWVLSTPAHHRVHRLGLPFAVAATTLIPLAYYPSFRMTGADAGFWRFWSDMVFSGPWPSGPLWFIAMLLGFDAVVALLFSLGLYPRLSPTRLSPLAFAGLLMTMSAIAYLPLLAEFGARRWLTFGPLAVQASRIGLYALYFLAGVWLGRSGADRGLIAPTGALSRHWAAWTASLVAVTLAATQAVKLRSDNLPPEIAWLNPRGLALVIFCTTACLALLAMFLRFGTLPRPTRNSLAANAYGIFILHYPLVTWTQYALLGTRTGAVVKAGLAFGVALALSWLAAALLRRVPGVRAIV